MAKEMTEYEAFKHINELFGESIRNTGELEKVDIIPTKSSALDRALGVGGWPRGRIIQLAGKPSAGKTLLSLLAIAEWQKMDPENCACFIDCEYTWDNKWASALGVQLDRVLLIKNNNGVEIFTGLVGDLKINQTTKAITRIPGLLDFIIEGKIIKAKHSQTEEIISLNCGKLGIIVLDSVAAVNTPIEDASKVGKQNMMVMGRFLSTELKKLTPAIAKSNVAFMAINQVRTDPGVLFGDPTTTSGGNAWKHACSVMCMLAPLLRNDTKVMDNNEEQIGARIKAKITKNKVAPPFREAEYVLQFDHGIINQAAELLDTGVITGAIIRPNNKTYIIGEEKIVSRDSAVEFVSKNYAFIESLVRESYLNIPTSLSNEKVPEENNEEEGENPFVISE